MKRALLVGAGGMGRTWANVLAQHPDVELAAWVDIAEGRAAQGAKDLGLTGVACGQDLAVALASAGADFAVDVTVPEAHRETVIECLEAGLPVLGEKPMAASMADALAMVEASAETGQMYMVSQSRRYLPGLALMRERLPEIGALGSIYADFFIGAHFGGFRDEMASVLLADMAIHTLDEARAITGLVPISVVADEFRPSWSWYQGACSASAVFEMEGGVRFNYRGSWSAQGAETSWDGDWRAVGEKGTLLWPGALEVESQVVSGSEGFIRPTTRSVYRADDQDFLSGIEGSLAEFLAALDGGPEPQGLCEDNILSLAMVFAAIQSSAEGRRVLIDEMLNP
jgi:predicted dehydrogenase